MAEKVSIFSFDPTLQIKSEGLLYQVAGTKLDMWWRATLNIALSNSFSLEFSHRAKVLLFISAEQR